MIDLYCERLDSSFWAEPINALTNVAFIIAAWGVWRLGCKQKSNGVSNMGIANSNGLNWHR